MIRALLVVASTVFLSACTHFSDESLRLADSSVRFEQLVATPDAYIGKTVIAGGVIAANLNTPEGTALEIVQFDLADDHTPKDFLSSGGRFLATTPAFAETAQYLPGDVVTVIGEVKGKKVFVREGTEQICPILSIREIRAWNSSRDLPPPLQSNYDPYFWGYPVDRYHDRPAGPVLKRH